MLIFECLPSTFRHFWVMEKSFSSTRRSVSCAGSLSAEDARKPRLLRLDLTPLTKELEDGLSEYKLRMRQVKLR